MPSSESTELDQLEATDTLLARIQACNSLPVLSPLATKILNMCQDEEAETAKLAELISQDPAMAVKILAMANSGYYGGGRHKVTSILQAVKLLGFVTIANLALSFCFYHLIKGMNSPNTSKINHVQFWRRSIFSSIAGRAIGKHFASPHTELVYLAALLQDIGILALHEVAVEEMKTIRAQSPQNHDDLCQLERKYLGVDHSQVGTWLAQQWKLPEEFQIAILYSHTPELLETPSDFQALVDVVSLSSLIADIWIEPDREAAIAIAQEKGLSSLSIQPEDWGPILDHFIEGIPQIAGFFQTQLGSVDEINQIHHCALQQLAPSHLESLTQKSKTQDLAETVTVTKHSNSWWNIQSRLRT
ncbi:MAG: HDOD domain-containing protein [Nitrospirota bacterium]|nr:HDOD domain-containing protein [Nitrospirota bacterium]